MPSAGGAASSEWTAATYTTALSAAFQSTGSRHHAFVSHLGPCHGDLSASALDGIDHLPVERRRVSERRPARATYDNRAHSLRRAGALCSPFLTFSSTD